MSDPETKWPDDNSDEMSNWSHDKLRTRFTTWVVEEFVVEGSKGVRKSMHDVMWVMMLWERNRVKSEDKPAVNAEIEKMKQDIRDIRAELAALAKADMAMHREEAWAKFQALEDRLGRLGEPKT